MSPLYCFDCPECGEEYVEFRPVRDRNLPVRCKCGAECQRNLQAEHSSPRNASCGEIESVNAGVGVKQIDEANRMYADLGVRFDARTGNMIAPDRRTFLRALDRRGIVNADEICGGH